MIAEACIRLGIPRLQASKLIIRILPLHSAIEDFCSTLAPGLTGGFTFRHKTVVRLANRDRCCSCRTHRTLRRFFPLSGSSAAGLGATAWLVQVACQLGYAQESA